MIELKDIISVEDYLEKENLRIPPYQRPYKWTEKNVNQLIDDIVANSDREEYRLGTIIIHYNRINEGSKESYDIVDGQQRTITLILLAKAIAPEMQLPASKFIFENQTSIDNIKTNAALIQQRCADFANNEKIRNFFLKKCKVVFIVINNASEAFQLFDSQNARGKSLEPHDYLKAFHLREMNSCTEAEKLSVVAEWEKHKSEDTANLFFWYLYFTRQLFKKKDNLYFTKDDIDAFKGINIDNKLYPYYQIYNIAQHYTEYFNESHHSKILRKKIEFPFQLNQPILNGKLFFGMVSHYFQAIDHLEKNYLTPKEDMKIDNPIRAINEYKGRYRTGDWYVNNLFRAALLAYYDKFGDEGLKEVIPKIFKWAYTLRLTSHAVYFESLSKYVLHDSPINMFERIEEATAPSDILNIVLPQIEEVKTNTDMVSEILKCFGIEIKK